MTNKKAKAKLFSCLRKHLGFEQAVAIKKAIQASYFNFSHQAISFVKNPANFEPFSMSFQEEWDSDYIQPDLDPSSVICSFSDSNKTVHLIRQKKFSD